MTLSHLFLRSSWSNRLLKRSGIKLVIMSEGDRGSRAPPKPSKGLKRFTSPSKEPKAHASVAAQAESSDGAAKAQRSASQSAAAGDQSDRGVQDAQAALSALQLPTSRASTVQRCGAAASGSLESPVSPARSSKVGPSGAATGSLSAPTSSRSSQTRVAADLPSRRAWPRTPVSQSGAAALSTGSLTFNPDSISEQAAEDQKLLGAKSGPSGTPRPASQPTEPQLTRSRRGTPSAAPVAQGVPALRERSTRQGGARNSSGLRMPRLAHNEPSRSPLSDQTSKVNSSPQSGGGAAHAFGPAGSSASAALSEVLGRGAASLTRGILGQPADAAISTTTSQTSQRSAAETSLTGTRTVVSSHTEASAPEVSRATLLALYKNSPKP
jgi:hypothetical protein